MIEITLLDGEYKLFLNSEILKSTVYKANLSINNSKKNSDEIFEDLARENGWIIHLWDDESKKLQHESLESLGDVFQLSLTYPKFFPNFWLNIILFKVDDYEGLKLGVKPNLNHWKYPFSYSHYQTNFLKNFDYTKLETKNFEDLQLGIEEHTEDGINIAYRTSFEGKLIKQIYLKIVEVLADIHQNTIQTLLKNKSEEFISYQFNFPEEIKIACEQYLLYFAQFLQDLGINTTSKLKEEAGKVLFSVTPTDDVEALDKIREALAIYLSLSSNPIPHSTGDRTVDMVLSGARANAKHLESQLELAIAKLQFKEATLELKDATIEQNQLVLRQRDDTIKDLKEMLARGNIFEESLEKVVINGEVVEETSLYRFSREDAIEVEATPISEEKSEEARIGLVKFHEVTKLKDYGVSLDLPKAIRGLIDYFKRDKDSR